MGQKKRFPVIHYKRVFIISLFLFFLVQFTNSQGTIKKTLLDDGVEHYARVETKTQKPWFWQIIGQSLEFRPQWQPGM